MKSSGFTLIELLIVLALIGILSLIAYPSYNKYVIRTRRVHVASTLLDIAGRMEKYYARHHTYEGADLENLGIDKTRYEEYYEVKPIPKDDGYILEATPVGTQRKDARCGTLTLDQNGKRGINGIGDLNGCWL